MAKQTKVRVRAQAAQDSRFKIFKFDGEAEPVREDLPFRALKDYTGRRQLEDPFRDEYGSMGSTYHVLEPTYSFYALMRLPDENSMLRQCIDAMVTNIDGNGYQLEYTGPEGGMESAEAVAEKRRIEQLLDYPNDEYTLQEMRDRLRRDLETLGNAYIEVGFDKDNQVVMMAHIPAHTMRMTKREDQPVSVPVFLPRDGQMTTQIVRKRFRRYVQQVGVRRIYFKEIGDPRQIDPATGLSNTNLTQEESATSIIHISFYNPGSPYGLPRWFNQLPAIMGTRQAELTNLDFFKDNAIPAMAILVSGGTLTEDTVRHVEDHFNAVRGRQSFNRLLVIEATGDEEAASDSGNLPPPRLELKPMVNERQGDGLFQEYEKNNRDKIRSAFRLPPLFVGLSEDMTYATAKTAYEVAESQVFSPERQRFDDMVNLKLLSTLRTQFWRFRSLPPRMSDPDDIMKAIAAFDATGAMTPNVAIEIANQHFDMEIKPVPEEERWGDYPIAMVTKLIELGRLNIEALEGTDGKTLGDLSARLDELAGQLQPAAQPVPANDAVPAEEGVPQEETTAQRGDLNGAVVSALMDLRRVIKRAQGNE